MRLSLAETVDLQKQYPFEQILCFEYESLSKLNTLDLSLRTNNMFFTAKDFRMQNESSTMAAHQEVYNFVNFLSLCKNGENANLSL